MRLGLVLSYIYFVNALLQVAVGRLDLLHLLVELRVDLSPVLDVFLDDLLEVPKHRVEFFHCQTVQLPTVGHYPLVSFIDQLNKLDVFLEESF